MKKKQVFVWFGILMLVMSVLASLALGSRMVPLKEVLDSLFFGGFESFSGVVVRERLPRTVFGLAAGASLAVSGTLMQAVTRNPIADPSILGVNTGASLFVVIGMSFFSMSSLTTYIWMALAGAFLTAFFVYSVGSMGYGGMTPIKLALAGAATSAALSSLISAVILPRTEVLNAFRFWQVGSIGGATWDSLKMIGPFLVIGLILAFVLLPSLDLLSLGEEMATGLGGNPTMIRLLGTFSSVLLCGATTAAAGPIGFVGIMVPHLLKLLWGPNLRMVLPMSVLYGGSLLLLADVLGRLLGSPSELESGIVTAFLGAPVLIYVAIKTKGKGLT